MDAEIVTPLGLGPWAVQPIVIWHTNYISCNLLYHSELSMYIHLKTCHVYIIIIPSQGKLLVPNFSLSFGIYQLDLCFLGTLVKLQKGSITFIMSVFLSVCPCAWKNSAPTGWIFMKFDI
jgi:hypothetical protein